MLSQWTTTPTPTSVFYRSTLKVRKQETIEWKKTWYLEIGQPLIAWPWISLCSKHKLIMALDNWHYVKTFQNDFWSLYLLICNLQDKGGKHWIFSSDVTFFSYPYFMRSMFLKYVCCPNPMKCRVYTLQSMCGRNPVVLAIFQHILISENQRQCPTQHFLGNW